MSGDLKIEITIGKMGTPAVAMAGSKYPQPDDEIVVQVKLWAAQLGKQEVAGILKRLSDDLNPAVETSKYLVKDQERPSGQGAPMYDYPQPLVAGQWSFIQFVYALVTRFSAEEVHRPRALGFGGATYTAESYIKDIP